MSCGPNDWIASIEGPTFESHARWQPQVHASRDRKLSLVEGRTRLADDKCPCRDVIAEREETVMGWARAAAVPVAFVLAGGYTGPRLSRDEAGGLHRLTVLAARRPLIHSAATPVQATPDGPTCTVPAPAANLIVTVNALTLTCRSRT